MTEPIARIEAALRRLGAEHEPPVGWEARVLAATVRQEPQRRWWWVGVPAMAVAAAVLLWVVLPSPRPPELALQIEVERSTEAKSVVRGVEQPPVAHSTGVRQRAVLRTSEGRQGDKIHATAKDGGPNRALWIYRDEQLIIHCPGSPQCRAADDAVFQLDLLGTYSIVALSSPASLPAIQIGDMFDPTITLLSEDVVPQIHKIRVR